MWPDLVNARGGRVLWTEGVIYVCLSVCLALFIYLRVCLAVSLSLLFQEPHNSFQKHYNLPLESLQPFISTLQHTKALEHTRSPAPYRKHRAIS